MSAVVEPKSGMATLIQCCSSACAWEIVKPNWRRRWCLTVTNVNNWIKTNVIFYYQFQYKGLVHLYRFTLELTLIHIYAVCSESQLTTGSMSLWSIKTIITHCTPLSIVVDLQTSSSVWWWYISRRWNQTNWSNWLAWRDVRPNLTCFNRSNLLIVLKHYKNFDDFLII